jgi:hypothetical protein
MACDSIAVVAGCREGDKTGGMRGIKKLQDVEQNFSWQTFKVPRHDFPQWFCQSTAASMNETSSVNSVSGVK